MTKERPILFSAPMVRAILSGRKTQTRRRVKPQHGFSPSMRTAEYCAQISPYGAPGDRLWVRETFLHVADFHGKDVTWYRADDDTFPGQWKPSIFMPRAASRITLEVTGVRVERLNEMPPEDARSEGCGSAEIPWMSGPLASDPWRNTYAQLWESINGAGSWAANPWVWVIEFKRVP
jgi:uncharacterized protein YhfF